MWVLFSSIIVVCAIYLLFLKDKGKPHSHYFFQMQEILKKQGPGHPALVLDLDILNSNIETLKTHFKNGKTFRVVAKSLPSLPLLKHILERTDGREVMVFHGPFLGLMLEQIPQVNFLVGKPFPIQTLTHIFKIPFVAKNNTQTCDRVQWLIDNPNRAEQYLEFAKEHQVKLKINIEIDVGLHRGGVRNNETLGNILSIIKNNPDHLVFSGFMGYEPHAAKKPFSTMAQIEKAKRKAMLRYKLFVAFLRQNFPELYREDLTFNGAGSPTYQLYKNDNTLNDLSVGSSLVKPTDFDLKTIKHKEPALFIATPVIKHLDGALIPYIEKASMLISKINPNWAETLFIYGGYWKAKPISPKGIKSNEVYGRSSNQEIMTAPRSAQVKQDDYVFLRPTQSEAVMLEFGSMYIYSNGKIVDKWPVFTQELKHSPLENGGI